MSPRRAAATLGISRTYLRAFIDKGDLPPPDRDRPIGQHCLVWFKAEDVYALAKRYKPSKSKQNREPDRIAAHERDGGGIAARAFRLLASNPNLPWQTLVVELEIDPVIARRLWSEYRRTPTDDENDRRMQEALRNERVAMREHGRNSRLANMMDHETRQQRKLGKRGPIEQPREQQTKEAKTP